MATYVSLVNWTDQGIRGFKDTVTRADAVAQLMERHGGKLKDIYWCLGQYDLVAIIEAPDEQEATAAALEIGAGGSVRTTTLRAFTRDEMQAILARTA